MLTDNGYTGTGIGVHTPIKQPPGGQVGTMLRAVAGLVSSQKRAPQSDKHYQVKALTADAAG